jgi:purine-cytosine permease-like protein
MILGAAIGGAVPNIPAWEDGYNSNSIGGVISVILKHSGGGGKFLLVLLAFSVLSNMIGTVYAMALNCQVLLASVSVRVPRVILTVILTAIMIPVAIKVAQDFLGSLSNFLGVISYWSAAYVAVLLVEHFVFRKRNFVNYDLTQWDQSAGLPSGIASLGAAILSFGLVVPGMDQLWFSGPFVKTTGDIGVELAFFVTAILYVPFRTLEIKLRGKV